MTENKLYAQCREEARKIIYDNIGVSKIKHDLAQLTAEIYGMKLLDMAKESRVCYDLENKIWEDYDDEIPIGITQDLHDHFVEQFNKEGK